MSGAEDVDLEDGPAEVVAAANGAGAPAPALAAATAAAASSSAADDATLPPSSAPPLVLEWRLSAFVRVPDAAAARRSACVALVRAPPTRMRQILFAVEGVIKPGVMLGVLGPSGCGKTTLLSALGRRTEAQVKGVIKVRVPSRIAVRACSSICARGRVRCQTLTSIALAAARR
jgi:ABC-type multidrug transport system fused ATPase/permease subunit